MSEIILSKVCSKCKVEKPLSEFNTQKSVKNGYRSHCKICIKEYQIKNKERIAKYHKQYQKDHEEEIKAQKKEYRQTDRYEKRIKKYQKENSKRISDIHRKYVEKHKEKITAWQKAYLQTEVGKNASLKGSHKRRALKLNATVEDFTPSEVFERDGYICQICGCKTRPDFKNKYNPKYPHLDHVIPLSKGGEHSRRNTQCLCRKCNIKKNNNEHFGDQLRMFG